METPTDNLPALVNGTALALAPDHNALPMPVQVSQIINRVKAVKEIVSGVFVKGDHFGEIPGTAKNRDGSPKMVLLKPGFDALCLAFQFAPEFVKQPESVESDKFINIVYKCRLRHIPTDRIIATGDGSCNSKEEKYRWTTAARTCPQCKGEFIRTSKPADEQGFYCWKKIGGCGATFPKKCPEIENQPEGRKENDNPWNFHNTLTKMAQKRAGMAAIITACGLSSDFTQDMEDFEPTANAKSARAEGGIEIGGIDDQHGNYRPGHMEDPNYRGPGRQDLSDEPDRDASHRGELPPDWRNDAEKAVAQAEDAQFQPAATASQEEIDPETKLPYSKGIATARAWVKAKLKTAKTDEEITAIFNMAQKAGGAYLNAKAGILFTEARDALKKATV